MTWDEPEKDKTGKSPKHKAVATRRKLKGVLRQPMKKKTFTRADAIRVGKILNIDWKEIPLTEFIMGMNTELEHADITGGDEILSGKITLVHLRESKTYNTDLKRMEAGKCSIDRTEKFKKDLSDFLSRLSKTNKNDTTIPEFRRWITEDLMSFEERSPDEQIGQKINYEKSIGVESKVFWSIEEFLNKWLKENAEEHKDYIWYSGTTEDRYKKTMADGEIKVSTAETIQHKEFAHDIGTISLAKYKGDARFFSGISSKGLKNQIIYHIDIRKLDQSAMKKRDLFSTPGGEILYYKNIPVSAIILAETVYIAKKG